MSDTPRTDNAQWGTGKVTTNFARQLERELNAANERIKRLEEAGDAYSAEPCGCVCDGPCSHAPLYDKWIDAKRSQ